MSHVRSWFHRNRTLAQRSSGFTLVEMLVVAPLAIITVGVVVTAMVSMIGDSISSYTRAKNSYDIQDTLDRIEKDTRISTAFIGTFNAVPAGQGRNANATTNKLDATGFNAKNSNDLILNQTASSSNPYDSARNIVYYANQPNACNSATTYLNRPLSVKVAYFTVNDPAPATTSTLWRRVFVPTYNRNATPDSQTTCTDPWQRDTCPTLATTDCKAIDEKLVTNVTNFAVTYYDTAGKAITTKTDDSLRNAVNVKVDIAVQEKSAGNTVATTGSARAARTTGAVDMIPSTPTPYVYSPADNTSNNPVRTTIAWHPVPFAGYYTVDVTITRAGTKYTYSDTTQSANYAIGTRPNDVVTFSVKAVNDMGSSPAGVLPTYTTPLWTVANLQTGWECYSPASVYDCPSYTLTTGNILVVRGTAKNTTTTNGTVFGFPDNLGPTANAQFPILAAGAFARADYAWGNVTRVNLPSGGDSWLALDSIRFTSAAVTPATNWTPVPLSGTWADASGWGPRGYLTDSTGRVHTRGVLTSGANMNSAGAVGTLPLGSRPSATEILPGVNTQGFTPYFASFDINSSGTLETRGNGVAGSNQFSINSILYPSGYTNLTLANSWTNRAGYAPGGYKKGSDLLVSLHGVIKAGTMPGVNATTLLANLPAGYCPGKAETFAVTASPDGTSAKEVAARVDVGIYNSATGTCPLNLIGTTAFSSAVATTAAYVSLSSVSFLQEY